MECRHCGHELLAKHDGWDHHPYAGRLSPKPICSRPEPVARAAALIGNAAGILYWTGVVLTATVILVLILVTALTR